MFKVTFNLSRYRTTFEAFRNGVSILREKQKLDVLRKEDSV